MMVTINLATAIADHALGPKAAASAQGSSPPFTLLIVLALFALVVYLVIRTQRDRQRRAAQAQGQEEPGQKTRITGESDRVRELEPYIQEVKKFRDAIRTSGKSSANSFLIGERTETESREKVYEVTRCYYSIVLADPEPKLRIRRLHAWHWRDGSPTTQGDITTDISLEDSHALANLGNLTPAALGEMCVAALRTLNDMP